MKSTGIVRKIDELGRIVLPIELRNKLDIAPRDDLEIFTEENRIILQKHEGSCIFCGGTENVASYRGKLVCLACRRDLSLTPDGD